MSDQLPLIPDLPPAPPTPPKADLVRAAVIAFGVYDLAREAVGAAWGLIDADGFSDDEVWDELDAIIQDVPYTDPIPDHKIADTLRELDELAAEYTEWGFLS